MAQTTDGLSMAAAFAEVSDDGSAWTSLGPAGISTSYSGGEQLTGEQNTQDGSAPVVTHANKHSATTVEVTALYTETTDEAWDIVRTRWEGSDKTLYFRYAPAGDSGGNNLFTAADDADSAFACPIISCLPPASDSGDGSPSQFTFSILAPKFASSTVAT